MSRTPSFLAFHAYAKYKENARTPVKNFENYEHANSKKRIRSSPTGNTPVQAEKRRLDALVHNDSSLSRRKWTEEERNFLDSFLSEAGVVPSSGAGAFWEECAEKLNAQCSSARTGQMCRSQYSKVRSLFGNKRSAQTQTECNVNNIITVETQTEPVIPISNKKRSVSLFVPYDNDNEQAPGGGIKHHIVDSVNKRYSFSEISDTERAELLDVILSSDANTIAQTVLQTPSVYKCIKNDLTFQIEKGASSKCVRSQDSYLFQKKYDQLREFSFDNVFDELAQTQPFLLDCLLALCIPCKSKHLLNSDFIHNLIPKFSMIYSILMQTRFHELSRMQRLMTAVLIDEHVHEKVFDRLQVIGVSTSYQTALKIIEEIGHHNNDTVVKGIKEGHNIRIVGDNINVKLGVKYERSDHHGNMLNWFASAVILQETSFTGLSEIQQCEAEELQLAAFLPTMDDERQLKNDLTSLISKVTHEFLPQLQFLHNKAAVNVIPENAGDLARKNTIVPLPVLPLNEQKYSDVVQILDHYEDTISHLFEEAASPVQKVHVGGDLLTRERFTGAKGLRSGCATEKARFDHLYPITFEMWHTAMNFLLLIFKSLFDENSFEKGSMNAAKISLKRKTVTKEVQNHYDHDKDFFLSFLKSYIVEALCDFFGIEEITDRPTVNVPDDPNNTNCVQSKMDEFIDKYVFAVGTDATSVNVQETEVLTVTPLELLLPNGQKSTVSILKKQKQSSLVADYDRIKHYGHVVLQLGLIYMIFLDICKIPDRRRMICTFKYMMMIFKASNNRSKYALEILRFLCHQQSSYSLKVAHESFYGLFVNTEGKLNTHIPADLQMEHLIRKTKKLFKAAGPNNIEKSIVKKSKAIAGLSAISENYDELGGVVVRANRHKKKDSHEDEMKLVSDLRTVRPFAAVMGRKFPQFEKILSPFHNSMDKDHYTAWIKHHLKVLTYESGK